jgi:hypothetical protein
MNKEQKKEYNKKYRQENAERMTFLKNRWKMKNREQNTSWARETKRQNKIKAVEYAGGCCQLCGYNRCLAALEFHHINPEEKEYVPTQLLNCKWERIVLEINKCILLCANCHREVTYEYGELPTDEGR